MVSYRNQLLHLYVKCIIYSQIYCFPTSHIMEPAYSLNSSLTHVRHIVFVLASLQLYMYNCIYIHHSFIIAWCSHFIHFLFNEISMWEIIHEYYCGHIISFITYYTLNAIRQNDSRITFAFNFIMDPNASSSSTDSNRN